MTAKPKPITDLLTLKPTDPWAQAVYPEGHAPEHPGTFAEMEEIDIACGRKDSDTPPPTPKPPTPEPPVDPNWENMTWEQRLDALLGGWASSDGTINYDSPLCPFKQ